MRYFTLHRMEDETGVSGTGVVAWGVRWPDGSCSVRWLGKTPSFVNYEGVPTDAQIQRAGEKHVEIVHGHHGKTILVWSDNKDKQPPSKAEVVEVLNGRTPTVKTPVVELSIVENPPVEEEDLVLPVRRWWQFWKRG